MLPKLRVMCISCLFVHKLRYLPFVISDLVLVKRHESKSRNICANQIPQQTTHHVTNIHYSAISACVVAPLFHQHFYIRDGIQETIPKVGKHDFEKTRSKVICSKISIFSFQQKYEESIASNILIQMQVSSDDSMLNYSEKCVRHTTIRSHAESC